MSIDTRTLQNVHDAQIPSLSQRNPLGMNAIDELLEHNAIVYGSGSDILYWEPGLDTPNIIVSRERKDRKPSHITSIACINGRLYDAGYEGIIRDTITGNPLGTQQSSPIFRFTEYQGRVVAVREQGSTPVVYYADTDEVILRFYKAQDPDMPQFRILEARASSLELVATTNHLYVASENVVRINIGNNAWKVMKPAITIDVLTRYVSDFVLLASDRTHAYSIHTNHSRIMQTKTRRPSLLTTISLQPENKVIAYWKASNDTTSLPGPSMGFAQHFTMLSQAFILGLKVFDADNYGNYLAAVPITECMRKGEAEYAAPLILCRDAFERRLSPYGQGNSITTIPSTTLHTLIQEGKMQSLENNARHTCRLSQEEYGRHRQQPLFW